jgi:hypothetical protein
MACECKYCPVHVWMRFMKAVTARVKSVAKAIAGK